MALHGVSTVLVIWGSFVVPSSVISVESTAQT